MIEIVVMPLLNSHEVLVFSAGISHVYHLSA